MKTDVKKLENCQVELTIDLDKDEVGAVIKEVEKIYLREATVPGFRKGKAPIEIIRRDFAESMKGEIERRMYRKFYSDAVRAEALEEVGLTDLRDFVHTAEGGSFVAVIDVKPVFKLPNYKGLKIPSKEIKIKDDEVQAQLGRLRAAWAKYEDAKDGDAVAEGDFVQIDYSGTVGKKPILEINPEAKVVAEGKGFWTQVEEGRFLPEILEAVKGMKIGEAKEGIKAKFDKESAPEGLKGEKAVYTVKLVGFRRRILPTDAELVENAKAESIEKLTASIRESMEKAATEAEARRREDAAVEALMKKADFDVPGTLVRRAMDGYLSELDQRARRSGIGAEYFEQHRDDILRDAEAIAVKQVRFWYIASAIAEAEKLEAKDSEKGKKVIEFVLANAK